MEPCWYFADSSKAIEMNLKYLLIAVIAGCTHLSALSQACQGAIPGDAMIVSDTLAVSQNDLNHWVCSAGVLNYSGNRGSIYVEKGGFANVNGNDINVYLQNGSTALINGNQNIIWMDTDAIASVNGNDNTVNRVLGATVSDNGNGNIIALCASFTISYADAPADGCMVSPPSPIVGFNTTSGAVTESAGAVNLVVDIENADMNATEVTVSVTGGTATQGEDYNFNPATLMWPATDQNSMSVEISIIDDDKEEDSETVEITLSDPTNNASLANAVYILTINDNDRDLVGEGDTCRVSVAEDAIVIATVRIDAGNNKDYWLCSGADLTYTGDGSTIVVESGAGAVVTGNGNTIFVQMGAVATVTGSSNMVIVDAGGTAVVTGTSNQVFTRPDAVVTVTGLNNESFDCGLFLIDYELAPVDGCNLTSTQLLHSSDSRIKLLPNPTQDLLIVELDDLILESLYIVNSQGQMMSEVQVDRLHRYEYDVTMLPAGFYHVRVQTNMGQVVKKLLIFK